MDKKKVYKDLIYSVLFILLAILAVKAIEKQLKKMQPSKKETNFINANQITELSHLATLRVEISDLYEERKNIKTRGLLDKDNNEIKIITKFKGEAEIGIDLSKMKVKIIDSLNKIAQITLPDTEIIFFKLYPETKHSKIIFNDATVEDKIEFIKKARIKSKKSMMEELQKDKILMDSAKLRAKLLLKNFALKTGWKLIFYKLQLENKGE